MPIDFHSVPFPAGVAGADAVRPETCVAFTEGPAAHSDGKVYFSDIANNRIMCFDSRTGRKEIWAEPSGRANGLLFDAQERLLVCEGNEFGDNDGNRRVTRIDTRTGMTEVLADEFEGDQLNAPNDIAARANGQLFFTDPCYGDRSTMELSHDSVYRIDPDGQLTRIITQPEIQRPNGIALSPDERTLYLVDSCPVPGGNRKIWAFDLSPAGDVSHQRLVFDFGSGRGGDGMAVDRQGNLYVAAGIKLPRGAHETVDVPPGIYVMTPLGELLGRIPIDEDLLTNVTFGGDDLRTLYITAGKTLLSCRVSTPGYVVHRR